MENTQITSLPESPVICYIPYAVPSFITAEQFGAQKGMEAYNQFVCGWVKKVVLHKVLPPNFVITGRIRNFLTIGLTIEFIVLLSVLNN